jgi:G3E family GTPase
VLVEKLFFIIEASGEEDDNEEQLEEDYETQQEDEHDDASEGSDEVFGPVVDEEEAKKRISNKRASSFANVFRSKGFLWIATRPKNMGEWSQAGMMLTVSNGKWFIDLPAEMWPQNEQIVREIKKDFEGVLGDKRQELVFIGQFDKGDQEKICEELNACLVNDKEWEQYQKMKMGGWVDPWEEWFFTDEQE